MSESAWPGGPIEVFLVDVDGTLTDGGMYYSEQGLALKRFDVKDGLGLVRLREAGVEIAIISSDVSPIIAARLEKLGAARLVLGCDDKGRAVREILEERGVRPEEACYMGDDVSDLPAFREVGHTAAPADAVPQVCAAAQYVTTASGGHGAVREVCDLILAGLEPRPTSRPD